MEKDKIRESENNQYIFYKWPDETIELTWESTLAQKRRCGILFSKSGIDFFVSDMEPELGYCSGRLSEFDTRLLLNAIEGVLNGEAETETQQ